MSPFPLHIESDGTAFTRNHCSKILVPIRRHSGTEDTDTAAELVKAAPVNVTTPSEKVDRDDLRKQAPMPCTPIETAKNARRQRSMVQPFPVKELHQRIAGREAVSKDIEEAVEEAYQAALANDGWRRVARPSFEKLVQFYAPFANSAAVLDALANELALNQQSPASRFRLQPTLLVGPPGIGKTAVVYALSDLWGLPIHKFGAAQAQMAGQLAGTSRKWGNACAGIVFNAVAKSEFANPILIVDEVDKLPDDSRHPILPALLELLEPESASRFSDEFVEISFDASKMIVFLTANDISAVPEPLVSRCNVIHIAPPDSTQRRILIESEWEKLRRNSRIKIDLPAEQFEELATAQSDLRGLINGMRRAYGMAVRFGQRSAFIKLPDLQPLRRIGF